MGGYSCSVCGRKYEKASGFSFFGFPKKESLCNAWMQACGFEIDPRNDISKLKICSSHFEESCFRITRIGGPKLLKPDVVPSIFENSKNKKEKVVDSTSTIEDQPTEAVINQPIMSLPSGSQLVTTPKKRKIWGPRHALEMSPSHFSTPRRAKRHLSIIKRDIKKKDMRIRQLNQKTYRMRKKVSSLNQLIDHLKSKYLVSDTTEDILKAISSPALSEIIQRQLKNRRCYKYSEEIKTFALTLQYYSTRAYKYVRQTFKNLLPHPRTLTRWYKVIDGNVGFTKEAFSAIEAKAQTEQIILNICIDEMSIREHLHFDGSNYVGFVDCGSSTHNTDESDVPLARHALVFMGVSLTKYWKVPLGYFLINSLDGKERGRLLEMCLQLVHESGAICHSVTFDGASVNKSMAKSLGASFCLDSLKPMFPHPITGEDVFVFWDPCHMIKLVRNVFADYKLLKYNGETINWSDIIKLVNIQEREKLHAATKVRKRHIHYHDNKMNVRLAAQTLSESVGAALLFCSELMPEEFKSATATATFVKNFDKIFDILNSRRKFSVKKFNSSINDQTFDELNSFAETAISYIKELTTEQDIALVNTSRGTGFIGLIICLQNSFNLYKLLTTNYNFNFLITYKISQDHLETFFGTIRGRGGFNNNPTAFQFKSAYKKLLLYNKAVGSDRGNCDILKNVTLLSATSSDTIGDLNICPEPFEHDYIEKTLQLSKYVENVCTYIAGFVIKKISKYINCTTCLEYLNGTESEKNTLINIKNRMNLKTPSEDVEKLCYLIERSLRGNENFVFRKKFKNNIIYTIKNSECFSSLFQNFTCATSLGSHKKQLTDMIINYYLTARLHHICKTRSEKISLRQKYSKLILFKNM